MGRRVWMYYECNIKTSFVNKEMDSGAGLIQGSLLSGVARSAILCVPEFALAVQSDQNDLHKRYRSASIITDVPVIYED